MKRSFDNTNSFDPEWPAAPISGNTHRQGIFLRIGRVISACFALITTENLKKATRHVRVLNFGLLFAATRGLLIDKLSLQGQSTSDYDQIPIVPLAPSQPLVSVVIPCFNYGVFVEAAVDSVLAQTVSNIEIIIVDGGSTDTYTKDLLVRLKRPKTQIFFREGRHFVGSNRNFGIERARGRYICCLDADDTIAPTYFEKALFFLETYAYDCVSTAINLVGVRQGTVSLFEFPDLEAMTTGNHVHTCALFRRSLWSRSGGYHDTGIGSEHIAEDWDYFIRLAAQGARIRNICGEALFNYRIHENGSLSSTNVRSIQDQRKTILNRNKSMLGYKRKRLSTKQASRTLRCVKVGGMLADQMTSPERDREPTLMLALPFLIVGGAERLLSEVVRGLRREGWHIIVVTTIPQKSKDGDSSSWFATSTAQIYRLPSFLKRLEWDDFTDYLIDTRKPDCLLVAGSHYFYERLPQLRSRLPSMAIVDLLFNTIGHVDSHKLYKTMFTSVIAENQEVERWLKSIGWSTDRIKCIKSGIDTNEYVPVNPIMAWRESLGIAPDALIVGYSGRLSEEKAPDIFIKIARLCASEPKIHFVMTGGGPMAKLIDHEVSSLNVKNVTYLGLVDDVKAVVGQYDLLVLPSRNDGRPQIVLEALAMGIPVIASAIGGLPELVFDGQTGYLCTPADAQAFSDCILKLMLDKNKLEEMKTVSRRFAVNQLKITSMVEAYHDTLLDTIKINQIELNNIVSNSSKQLTKYRK